MFLALYLSLLDHKLSLIEPHCTYLKLYQDKLFIRTSHLLLALIGRTLNLWIDRMGLETIVCLKLLQLSGLRYLPWLLRLLP